jgi:hypothetical protein
MIPCVYIEIEDNPNCAGREPMRFRELEPAAVVTKVRVFDRRDDGEWCLVTGVGKDPAQHWAPAFVRKVEDSGVGVAYLIYGGIWGIRLCPADHRRPWRLDDRSQWGEPYLLLTDATDIVTTQSPP